MSEKRILRTLCFILVGLIGGVIGYFNEAVTIFFLNQKVLIAFLFIVIIFLSLYSANLKKRLSRNYCYDRDTDKELQNLRSKYYSEVDIQKTLQEHTEAMRSLSSSVEQLKKPAPKKRKR